MSEQKSIYQKLANTLCEMFSGWQLCNDYGILAKFNEGRVLIDVVTGKAEINGKLVKLSIAKVLHSWFDEQIQKNFKAKNEIENATVTVDYTSAPPRIKLPDLKWKCEAMVAAGGKEFHSALEKELLEDVIE